MKQELYIDGEAVGYSLLSKNVTRVLGDGYIYRLPSSGDVLRIVYLGLERNFGLTLDDFVSGYHSGRVIMSKRRRQYTLWMIYSLLLDRIAEINKKKPQLRM